MSAEQAAAQAAVAAANTPQQQPQGTPQQSAATPASVVNSSGDQLTCQWSSCGERLPSAEQLYVSIYQYRKMMGFCHQQRDVEIFQIANAALGPCL
jgi:hypothetical protein